MPVVILPPRVVGPVSVLSTHVNVDGANDGASVTLRANGTPVATYPAGAYGTVSIPVMDSLGNPTLNPGDLLTVIQTMGADTSDASQIPEPVLGFPSSLPPLVFLSEVHLCADSILLGGTCINAAITATLDGRVIGTARGNGGTVNVGLVGPLTEMHAVVATQTAMWRGQTVASPPVQSLPIQPSPVREGLLPAPYIVPPLWECDSSLTVSGILDGATVVLESNLGGHSDYAFQGNTASLYAGMFNLGEVMTATQVFKTCEMKGKPSAPAPVVKPGRDFPIPSMPATLCRDAPSITISNLMPGAILTISIGLTVDGATYYGVLGKPSVATKTQTFNLPPTSSIAPHPAGPWQFLLASQVRCGVGAVFSNEAHFIDGPTAPIAPFIGRLTECATTIRVDGLTAGAHLRLTSDQSDTPVLSLTYPVLTDTMDVPLYRSLRAGETVTATLTGCGGGPAAQLMRHVDMVTRLRPPTIRDLIRTWTHEILVLDCVPGAQVHIFVNGVWRNQATAYLDWVRIWVGTLAIEDQITVRQSLCTAISDPSTPPISVLPGELVLTQAPSPIERGSNPVAVTIFAADSDDGHAVAGLVHLPGGVTVPTNSQFSWAFPAGQPGPSASVTANGYASKPVAWALKDPVTPPTTPPTVPPSPAPTLTLNLQSIASNPPVVAIKAVQWEVLKSAGSTPAVIGTLTGPTASLPLPKPTAPAIFEYYFVGCTVKLTTIYGETTVSGVDAPFSTLPYHAMVEWRGASATAHFLLIGTPVKDNSGNQIDYVVEVKFEGL